MNRERLLNELRDLSIRIDNIHNERIRNITDELTQASDFVTDLITTIEDEGIEENEKESE